MAQDKKLSPPSPKLSLSKIVYYLFSKFKLGTQVLGLLQGLTKNHFLSLPNPLLYSLRSPFDPSWKYFTIFLGWIFLDFVSIYNVHHDHPLVPCHHPISLTPTSLVLLAILQI